MLDKCFFVSGMLLVTGMLLSVITTHTHIFLQDFREVLEYFLSTPCIVMSDSSTALLYCATLRESCGRSF